MKSYKKIKEANGRVYLAKESCFAGESITISVPVESYEEEGKTKMIQFIIDADLQSQVQIDEKVFTLEAYSPGWARLTVARKG